MKKIFAIAIVAAMLAIPGLALAGDPNQEDTKVVGDDIVIGEDEMKIVSLIEDEGPVVGEDIEIDEDMAKIISIDEDAIPVVGDDIEIGEGEAKIISIDEEPASSLPILPLGIGAGALILLTGGLIYRKRALRS